MTTNGLVTVTINQRHLFITKKRHKNFCAPRKLTADAHLFKVFLLKFIFADWLSVHRLTTGRKNAEK